MPQELAAFNFTAFLFRHKRFGGGCT